MKLSTPAWPMFIQVKKRLKLMDQMMELSGVDIPEAIRADDGQAFITARAQCRHCLHEHDCQNWLDSCEGLPLPPEFCPNMNYFRKHMVE